MEKLVMLQFQKKSINIKLPFLGPQTYIAKTKIICPYY